MQVSGVKQRQKSVKNGEKRRSEDEETVIRASRFSPDVKLSLSLMCLSVSIISTWLHVQQNAELAEITHKYQHLYEKSRSVQELQDKMAEVSQKLLASSSSVLKHTITSIHNASDALQAEQEASSLRIHALTERMRSLTETWSSGQEPASADLNELKRRSRAAHTHLTLHINEAEVLLHELKERLQEVQDGTGRNARVLDRTEEEDAGWVRRHLDWNERRVSRLQEQLQRLQEEGQQLRQRLETSAPHTQHWHDTHLPNAEEAVRSMLRLRAQLSATHRRLEELRLQCALASAPPVSLDAEVAHLQERFSRLTGQQQQLQQNLSALVGAVESVEKHAAQVSGDVTSRVSSIRTDVRRMAGLETEAEALLNQTRALEEKVAQTEKLMVKRIGELLAGSIDRVSALKSSAEKSGQRMDQIAALVHEISAANRKLSERILALESGQAKLLKTATFASDLKPKVFSIRQDFAIIEPKLDDLTLRIGLLAEDLMSREEERSDETTHDTLDQKDQLTP